MIQMFELRCKCGERYAITWGPRLIIVCGRCGRSISVAMGRSFRTDDTGLIALHLEKRSDHWLQMVRSARVLARKEVKRQSPYQAHQCALKAMAGVLAEDCLKHRPRDAGRPIAKKRLWAVDWLEVATHLSKSYDQWYLRSTLKRKPAKRVRIER